MSMARDASHDPLASGYQPKDAYRCPRCGFVVYVKAGQKPPPYCHNCALVHLKSEFVPLNKG